MTPLQYWSLWVVAGVVALVLARLVLVQPIINAIRGQ
jgi:uncharacterized membrane protein HdeD (DUF308 family)